MKGKSKHLSYDSTYFDSFDDLVEYLDNLGEDNMLISSVRGCTPISFLRRHIEKSEYERLQEYRGLYEPPNKHAFKQIMFRAKDPGYDLSRERLRVVDISIICPYNVVLSKRDKIMVNSANNACLEWGNKHSNDLTAPKITYTIGYMQGVSSKEDKNMFSFLRVLEMSGFSFGGGGKRYYKVGYDYIWIKED